MVNSYHTALFGKMLGIPTYLLSFNDYYSQKQSGIEVKQRALEEFLDEDPEVILKEQEEALKIHEEARAKWLKELKEVLSYEPKKAYLRAIYYYREEVARLKLSLEEKERLLNELKSETERLSEENITLKKHNNLLAEEVNRLSSYISHLKERLSFLENVKERLSFIENSRSWRFVEAWWRVNAHPIGRIVFSPIVKLIHLLWRK
jgi:Mg2+ and Co2+ transporter CorA